MSDTEKKIQLQGYMDVTPDRLEAVNTALVDHIALTQVEGGCISFEITPCPTVEGRFLVAEEFANCAAFDYHQSRAEKSVWAEVIAGLPRNYKITEV